MNRSSERGILHFLIFTAVFIIIFSNGYAAADEKKKNGEAFENLIGVVNMLEIYAHHPLMLYFDKDAGLFIKPVEASSLMAEALTRAESERNIEFKRSREAEATELRRLKNEIAGTENELQMIEHKTEMEIKNMTAGFNENIAGAKDEKEKKVREAKLKKNIENIKIDLSNERKRLEKKLKEMKQSLEVIQRSILKFHYLNLEESDKIFERIKTESIEAVKQIAADEGISFVLESGLMSGKTSGKKTSIRKNGDFITRSDKIEDMLQNGPSYTNILNLLMNTAKPAQVKNEGGTIKIEDNFNKISGGIALKRFQNILSESGFIKNIDDAGFQRFRNAPVIYGGKDITAKVIVKILEKNRIPKESIELISGYLQN